MGAVHDLVALIQQQSLNQIADIELHLIGHVIEYDPKVNMCRVLLPTRRGASDGEEDEPMETGWIQVGTPMVGAQWGIQYILKGGATKDNPEQGEQVQVSIQHRESGLCAVANLTFNDTMPPPMAGGEGSDQQDESQPKGWDEDPYGLILGKPCEWILRHKSGSFLKFYESGDVQLYTAQTLHAYVQQDLDCVIREGDADITVDQGDANVTVSEGDVNVDVTIGSATVEAGTDITLNAAQDVKIIAGRNVDITAADDVNITATAGSVNITGA